MIIFSVKLKFWRIVSFIVFLLIILGAVYLLTHPTVGVFYPVDNVIAKIIKWF